MLEAHRNNARNIIDRCRVTVDRKIAVRGSLCGSLSALFNVLENSEDNALNFEASDLLETWS